LEQISFFEHPSPKSEPFGNNVSVIEANPTIALAKLAA
jgi:hypothetical protein